MKKTSVDRAVILSLSFLLLAGIIALHVKRFLPGDGPVILRKAAKEVRSLREIEAEIREERRVNVNAAGAKELERLPGVGPEMASRIDEHRKRYGKFTGIGDLGRVSGIGPKKLEKMREYVKFK